MISILKGPIAEKSASSMVIMAGGVGYEVFIPLSTFYELPDEGEEASLHIKTVVREDAIELFGFLTPLEKQAFLILNSVSKVGPRLALNILSGIGPSELAGAVGRKDVARLNSVPGVGPKTAERLIVELKDKVAPLAAAAGPEVKPEAEPVKIDDLGQDVVSALINLGYSRQEAEKAVAAAGKELGADSFDLATLLRLSLSKLRKG